MNDTAQIIIAVATLITSIGTIVLGLVNRKTITTIQTQTNGMMKKLEQPPPRAIFRGARTRRRSFRRGVKWSSRRRARRRSPRMGSVMVLLKFDAPKSGHLMGELPIDLGQLERDVLYRVTIERVEPGTISSDAG